MLLYLCRLLLLLSSQFREESVSLYRIREEGAFKKLVLISYVSITVFYAADAALYCVMEYIECKHIYYAIAVYELYHRLLLLRESSPLKRRKVTVKHRKIKMAAIAATAASTFMTQSTAPCIQHANTTASTVVVAELVFVQRPRPNKPVTRKKRQAGTKPCKRSTKNGRRAAEVERLTKEAEKGRRDVNKTSKTSKTSKTTRKPSRPSKAALAAIHNKREETRLRRQEADKDRKQWKKRCELPRVTLAEQLTKPRLIVVESEAKVSVEEEWASLRADTSRQQPHVLSPKNWKPRVMQRQR